MTSFVKRWLVSSYGHREKWFKLPGWSVMMRVLAVIYFISAQFAIFIQGWQNNNKFITYRMAQSQTFHAYIIRLHYYHFNVEITAHDVSICEEHLKLVKKSVANMKCDVTKQ